MTVDQLLEENREEGQINLAYQCCTSIAGLRSNALIVNAFIVKFSCYFSLLRNGYV